MDYLTYMNLEKAFNTLPRNKKLEAYIEQTKINIIIKNLLQNNKNRVIWKQ